MGLVVAISAFKVRNAYLVKYIAGDAGLLILLKGGCHREVIGRRVTDFRKESSLTSFRETATRSKKSPTSRHNLAERETGCRRRRSIPRTRLRLDYTKCRRARRVRGLSRIRYVATAFNELEVRNLVGWFCQLRRLKRLETENVRLKRMVMDLSLDKVTLELVRKSCQERVAPRFCVVSK